VERNSDISKETASSVYSMIRASTAQRRGERMKTVYSEGFTTATACLVIVYETGRKIQ